MDSMSTAFEPLSEYEEPPSVADVDAALYEFESNPLNAVMEALPSYTPLSEYAATPLEADVDGHLHAFINELQARLEELDTETAMEEVSEYEMPLWSDETNVEMPVFIGNVEVVDSIECLHALPTAELVPAVFDDKRFSGPGVNLQ